MPITWFTRQPRAGKATTVISEHENLTINSKLIRVTSNQKYMLKATTICRQGILNAAYLCVMMLDQDGKEIVRKIKWINDFSGNACNHLLVFRTTNETKFAVLGFRINIENQSSQNIELTRGDFEIELPDISSLKLEIANNELDEEYDHLVASTFSPLTEKDETTLERKMVWIFGSPRSGSTWLGRDLLNHEQNIFWDEPYIGWFISELRKWEEDRIDYFYSNYHKDLLVPLLRKTILFRTYSLARTLTKNIIIKEPNGSGGADLIMKSLPNSKLIFLVRDGRDVVDSMLDTHAPYSWNEETTGVTIITEEDRAHWVKEYAAKWKFYSEIVLEAYNKHDPSLRLLIRYEDLRKDTVKELQKIYDFLGITITKEELEHLVKRHQFENIDPELRGPGKFYRSATPGKWKDNFKQEEKEIMKHIMNGTLIKFGYQ